MNEGESAGPARTKRRLTRREFLVGGARFLTALGAATIGEPVMRVLAEGDQAAKWEYVDQIRRQTMPRFKEIDERVRNTKPGTPIPYNEIPAFGEVARTVDPLERVRLAVRGLGVENSDFVASDLERGQLWERLQILKKEIPKLSLEQRDMAESLLADLDKKWRQKADEAYWLRNPRYDFSPNGTCNIYGVDLMRALGLGQQISLRVDAQNRPMTDGSGKELGVGGMYRWLREHSGNYGWSEVTRLSYPEKQRLLGEGNIFYGAWQRHNYVIFGTRFGGNGEVLPTLTQSTNHHLMVYMSPDEFKIQGGRVDNATDVRLYSIPLPEVLPPMHHPDGAHYIDQRFSGECAPACIAMLMSKKVSGVDKAFLRNQLSEITQVSPTRFLNFDEVATIFIGLGQKPEFQFGFNDEVRMKAHFSKPGASPVMVWVNDAFAANGRFNHFVAVWGFERDQKGREGLAVFDPQKNQGKGNLLRGMQPYVEGPLWMPFEVFANGCTSSDEKVQKSGQGIILR